MLDTLFNITPSNQQEMLTGVLEFIANRPSDYAENLVLREKKLQESEASAMNVQCHVDLFTLDQKTTESAARSS